jgi:repressor LexA
MSAAPTPRQLEIAEFLGAELQRRGVMPTQREIADRFQFASVNSVRSHIRLMERKGMLARQPGKARSLRLIVAPVGIPLLGRIAAGSPLEAIQDVEEFLPVSPGMFRGGELFALRVKGDSMKDVGILPGDIAVVNRQQDVTDGEIAAVLLEDDATLKIVHRRNGAVILRGANPAFRDVVIRRNDGRALRILGKYVGLIRKHGGAV